MRAAVYTRISKDTEGTGLGVDRQLRECRELADRRGWSIVATFSDNDRSAYSGKPRPGYRDLLDAIEAGTVDALIAWHPDRLHRSPVELEDFIDLIERNGVTIATVQGGEYDLGTASGRMTARVVGAVARHESEHKSERLRSKAAELARQGRNGGGGTRPFGFEDDRVTIRESEAKLIRDAARRLLAGESAYSVMRSWTAQGVPTVTGAPWARSTWKRIMTSPRIAGLREHRGEIVGEAEWPGIIEPADHYALHALLNDSSRTRQPPRKYLLTGGIAVCGLCGADLVARPRGDKRRCYVCASPPGFDGCGKIRALADPFEDFIGEAVIEAVSGEGLARALASLEANNDDTDALYRSLRELESRRDQLAVDHYRDGILSHREFLAARTAVTDEIDAVRGRLSAASAQPAVADLPTARDALERAWEERGIEWRQSVVSLVVESVIVNPAVRGRNTFDPTRFEIRWRA